MGKKEKKSKGAQDTIPSENTAQGNENVDNPEAHSGNVESVTNVVASPTSTKGLEFQPSLSGGSARKNKAFQASLTTPGRKNESSSTVPNLDDSSGGLAGRWADKDSSDDDWLDTDPDYVTSVDDGPPQPDPAIPGATMKWIRKHRRVPKIIKHKHLEEGSLYLLEA